jgi:hypothetical protein
VISIRLSQAYRSTDGVISINIKGATIQTTGAATISFTVHTQLSVPIVKQITNPSTATVLTVAPNLIANSASYALPLPTLFTEVLLYSTSSGNSEYSASSTTDLTLILKAPTVATFTPVPLSAI